MALPDGAVTCTVTQLPPGDTEPTWDAEHELPLNTAMEQEPGHKHVGLAGVPHVQPVELQARVSVTLCPS